jgi:hypothetical protein
MGRPGRCRDEGASAVEFALIAPLLIMLVVGVFEFGLNWYRTQNLASAAREGARLASVSGTQAEITDRVIAAQNAFAGADIVVNFMDVANAAITTDPPCQGRFGQEIKVEVVVPESAGYGISIPFWGLSDLEFRHAGVFRCEK